MTSVTSFTLPSGNIMPGLGLGTWKSDPGVVGEAVKIALRGGYRHIDCAAFYANEKEIGGALKDVFEGGEVKREDIFVTSKLWNTMHHVEDVETALRTSLDDLGLDYLDLYLIHWPVHVGPDGSLIAYEEIPITETWKVLEEFVDKGLIKDIGLSNFSVKKMKEILSVARIPPAVNQIERHPYLQHPSLLEFCKAKNIHVTGYSPLGSNDRPPSMITEGIRPILEDAKINSIAKKHGVTAAQVLIRWALDCGTSVIPKSTNANRIKENLESAAVELDGEDLAAIKNLNKNLRYIDGTFYCGEGSPYTLENLWDETETPTSSKTEL